MARRPEVLRRKRDFDRLYKKGRSTGDRYIVVFHGANGLEYSRRAFLASKKVGGAVERNRARRLMKEGFRRIENEVIPGKDILFIARKEMVSVGIGSGEVELSIKKALSKSGLLR